MLNDAKLAIRAKTTVDTSAICFLTTENEKKKMKEACLDYEYERSFGQVAMERFERDKGQQNYYTTL